MCYLNTIRTNQANYFLFNGHEIDLSTLDPGVLEQSARRGFDYADWPVLKPAADGGECNIVAMEWGFLPTHVSTAEQVNRFRFGYKKENGSFVPPYTTLNASGEELLKPGKMYRDAALHRRCLALSSGFFEHRHEHPIGKKGALLKTAVKYPYHISLPRTPVFMMAAIYQTWTDKETGETKDTFALVTTTANALMAQVHNSKMRMPVILPDELANEWATAGLTEQRISEIATFSFPADEMEAHTVKKSFLDEAEPADEHIYPNLTPLNL